VPPSKRIRDQYSHDKVEVTVRRPWYKRIPWTPVVITLVVLIASRYAVQPIRDAATLADVSEVHLVRPLGYVAMAPVSNVLDMLTLLSVLQHVALILGVIVLFVLSRVLRARRGGSNWRRHLLATGLLIAGIAIVYLAAVLLPRPMAQLASRDSNILRVDFHSHTSASRDARRGFSVEDNRAWHRSGGYDVAYITDHATVAGAEKGLANNPPAGLENPVLLQGIEATWTGEHVAILNAQRIYKGILTENLRDVDEQGLQMASVVATREPVVVWNHPNDLNRLPPAAGPGTAGVRAIEVANGSRNRMAKVRPKRAQIVALAERHNLALTSGSDNHGWGRTAPAWTLLRPVNWRGSDGDALALRIERVLREGGYRGTRVVERVGADPGASRTELALTIFSAPLRMLTTLSNDERLLWLIWTWAIAAGLWWKRRKRSS